MNAQDIYSGSDGDLTKSFYAELEKRGAIGVIGVNLFRAQKCSTRAKVYRGGRDGRRFKDMAYERKQWSLEQLVKCLEQHGHELGVTFGWGKDEKQKLNTWVLYIDLPGIGQVSFHSPTRHAGPDYPGDWDGEHASAERIIQFCQRVMDSGPPVAVPGVITGSVAGFSPTGGAGRQTALC